MIDLVWRYRLSLAWAGYIGYLILAWQTVERLR